MAKTNRKTVLILGCSALGVLFACAGLSALAFWGFSSVFGESEPEVTAAGTLSCPNGSVSVVNHHRVTNWLAGVSRDDALLVVDDIEVPLSRGRFRDWIPAERLPPHRVDGDASEEGYEVFFDPELIPAATAAATEACLVGRREEVLELIHRTAAHSWMPELEEGLVYWRASHEDLEPIFTHPNGETLLVVDGGVFSHDQGQMVYSAGQVTPREDGTFHVQLNLGLWGPPSAPAGDFVDGEGLTIEQFFGAPIDPEWALGPSALDGS